MSFTVLNAYAALLLLLLPLLWLKGGRAVPVAHRILRTVIFAAIVLALMQPSLLHDSGSRLHVIMLDQRSHIAPDDRREARLMADRIKTALPTGDEVAILQLGGDPVPAQGARLIRQSGETSLSTALGKALSLIPQGRSATVTVISDGLSPDSHWARAVRGLAARGIPVNTIALPRAQRTPFIADIAVPTVRRGEEARGVLTVDGDGRDLVVALYSGNRLLGRSAPFDVVGTRAVALPFTAGEAGFMSLRAVLEGERQDALATTLAVQPPLSILYLAGRQRGGAAALQTLLGKGFAVEERTPGSLGPGFDYGAYGAVMIDDVPAAQLPAPAQRRLLASVAQGRTGLIYSGGEAAFGPGGYAQTPLAPALPVTLRQEDKVEKPSVALAIVIDTSGSMQGQPLNLAKQVSRFTVQTLTPQDSVGVVEFYGTRQWSVPMQPASDIPGIERAIGRMQANGGSVLYPAIQEAYFGLKNTDTRYKHILVISDAGVEEARYEQLLRHIAQDRVNVSTVLVGADAQGEERMAEWARWGRGRYYAVTDETSIVQPRLNEPQVKPSPGYREGDFALRAPNGNAWWGGMSISAMPALGGYAVSGTRPEAQTVLTTAGGDPVLATWPYGAGRVTALMTEPVGGGTASWRGWRGYGQWLGRVIARSADRQSPLEVTLWREFGTLELTVRTPVTEAGETAPQISLIDENGTTAPLPARLEQRAPGLFTATIPFPADRTAKVEARHAGRLARAADRPRSDMSATDRMPVARALPLAGLSRITGGTFAGNAADASVSALSDKSSQEDGTLTAVNLWSFLILLALMLYLAELAYRRWPTRRKIA